MISTPKVLFLDTEVAKSLYAKFPPKRPEFDGYKNVIKDWWFICGAWKWAGNKRVEGVSVLDHKARYKANPTDDYHVVKTLCQEMTKADILIGHNVDGFDWKKLNARAVFHGLEPVNKPRVIDTYKMAKATGEFTSFSLDYLTKYFKISGKAENRGNDMWNDLIRFALERDEEAFREVIEEIGEYCGPDVTACEALYYRLLPYAPARFAINLNLYTDGEVCPKCGHAHLVKDGFRRTNTGVYQSYQCKKCKSYCQDSRSVKRAKKK